jgi:arsenate reductase
MSDKVTIYHNPRCQKSRQALALLREKGIEPEIVEYLKDIPTAEEIKKVLARLHVPVSDIIRREEQEYKTRYKGMSFNEDEWIQILRENPKLIQRPLVFKSNKGVIGRPPENIHQLF